MEDSKMVMYTYYVKLLKAALNGMVPDNPPDNLDWNKLYTLAERQSVACTVYYGIMKLPAEARPDKSVMALFKKSSQVALGMGVRQELELSSVMAMMDEEGIGYIPLKGWHMKRMYPRPDMRYMCDVDILIDKNTLKKVSDIMEKCGFEFKTNGANDYGYIKNNTITAEIHWLLFEEKSEWYDYFKNYYAESEPCEEGGRRCERKFTKEQFFMHMLVHLVKHFKGSGTGIRSVMDIYIYNKQYGKELDWIYLENELDKLELKGFLHAVLELAEDMFAPDSDDMLKRHPKMALHVLSTGMYGDRATSVKNSVTKKYNNKFSYMMHRIFLDRSKMKLAYPCLEKAPFLLPVFWVVRLVRVLLFSRNNMKAELGALYAMDDSEKERMTEIMKDSGLM